MYHHGAKWAAASDIGKKKHTVIYWRLVMKHEAGAARFLTLAERKYCRRELSRLEEHCHTDTRGIIREKQMEAVIH